ncbi:fructose-6-phosphate aldolase [Acanthopleuribacter pedis]|uniref:Probable transaldolase n=1 Tax=Acanthopleuribacter pedis TaxID=442870 RepID=A0A8J7U1U1_9BACT|nr:fructose-6-phosphate aldolase [Acanthopleuribacter pedis]MBO1317882.1 fructose-6-phosphate aldolase [Acanthopleuribacter pedis]
MKFFLDTAIVDEIKEGVALGLVDGVTTNPSLIAKSGRDHKEVVLEICELIDGPVSAEVIATDYEGMLAEARELAAWHEQIVVKVPLTEAGLKTVSKLAPEGVRFNVTLCFSAAQALLAAKAGASFISPFVGRWDDIDSRGIDLIPDIVTIYENYGFATEVLVASVRSPLHVSEAAMVGAQIATVPFKILKQMFKHPLTDIGIERFLEDYRKSQA